MLLGLPDYEIKSIDEIAGQVEIQARYTGALSCTHCREAKLRPKERRTRRLRHENWRMRQCVLELETFNGNAGPAAAASGSGFGNPAAPAYHRRTMGQVSRNYWATVSPEEKRKRAQKSARARWARNRAVAQQ